MIDARGGADRRFRASTELIGVTPSSEELLADEVDGQLYAYKKEWRCYVCRLAPDLREIVDSLIVHGHRYSDVLRMIIPTLEARGVRESQRPTYDSIRNHQKRHLPYDKLAIRQIVERRAAADGKNILEGADRLLTYAAVLEVVTQRGFDAIVDKAIEPTISETMTAAARLEALEREAAGSVTTQELMTQLNVLLRVVQEVVPKEYWIKIRERIQQVRAEMSLPQAV